MRRWSREWNCVGAADILRAISGVQFRGRTEGPRVKKELNRLESAQRDIQAGAPYDVSRPYTLPHHMVTTAFALDGFRVVRSLGVVRGITVRSRSLIGNIGAAFQTIVGG